MYICNYIYIYTSINIRHIYIIIYLRHQPISAYLHLTSCKWISHSSLQYHIEHISNTMVCHVFDTWTIYMFFHDVYIPACLIPNLIRCGQTTTVAT